MATAYDTLADLAERELELVTAGAMERLPEVYSEREAVMASLPPRPPAGARAALERALTVQARVTAALEARKHDLAAELARIGKGQTMLRGYKPAGLPLRGGVDHSG